MAMLVYQRVDFDMIVFMCFPSFREDDISMSYLCHALALGSMGCISFYDVEVWHDMVGSVQ